MDDKLIRLARKVKAIEDELDKVTQIKDLEGLLFVKRDIINQYKKSINEIVNMYKDYISSTKSELSNTMKTIQKEHKDDKVIIDNIETKISTIKEDIKNICTGLDKSIESIQKDILKDIKEKNSEILLNFGKKDKEIAEVKKEILPLVKDLKALKDLVNKLELQKGDDGKSAYEIACELGFKGTKEEWIKSLHGKDGQDIELRGLRGFSDVKKDNKSYLRKNKKWVEYEEYDDKEIRKDISEIQEEQTEQNTLIATLQEENTRLKATLPTTTGTGTNITLDKTAVMEFIKPPLPRGNSTQVQYSGKNLFNIEAITENTYLGVQGATGTSSVSNLSDYIPVKANQTYIFHYNYTSLMIDGERAYCLYDNNKVHLLGNSYLSSNKKIVFTPSQNGFFRIAYDKNCIDIMLEEGSTATSYEPYVGGTASPNPSYPQSINNVTGDVEVLVQNKNLFDKNNITTEKTYSSTGEIIDLPTAFIQEKYIPVISSTQYSLSTQTNYSSTVDYRLVICEYDENKNFIKRNIAYESGITKSTITTTSTTKYVRLCASTVTLNELQFEKGNSRTTYTPHQEQTFTFPLGTQRLMLGDYLADDGIHHVSSQVTFDGTEASSLWSKSALSNNYYRFYYNLTTKKSDNEVMIKSNLLRGITYNDRANDLADTIYSSGTNIGINTNKATTVAELQALYVQNNMILEYLLSEETITPYTTEQQEVYDAIKEAISYYEQTNITGTSDEAEPIFDVEAYQNTKLVLASLS